MTKLRILGVAGLVLVMGASELMAQRRGGGAVRGGMRGAMVGGMAGGSSGAQRGAKAGVVVGATRGAVRRVDERAAYRSAVGTEAQARMQYQTSAEYQNVQHSDFNEAPPEVIVSSTTPFTTAQSEEAIIRKDGKPVLGITFPADWKQALGDHYVSAVSSDGQAWSVISTLDDIKDKEAGIERIKKGLAKHLRDIEYDELTETERGALVVTGTGTGKKAGIDVVFAAGVFPSGEEQLSGTAFIVDAGIEEHYKETVRFICQTIRVEEDFAE